MTIEASWALMFRSLMIAGENGGQEVLLAVVLMRRLLDDVPCVMMRRFEVCSEEATSIDETLKVFGV